MYKILENGIQRGKNNMFTIGIFVDNRQLDKVTQKHLVEERSKLKKLHRLRKTIATYSKLQPITKQTSTFKLH